MTNSEYRDFWRREFEADRNALDEEDPIPEPQPPNCNYCKYLKDGFCAVNPSYLGNAANCPDYKPLFVI